MNSFDYLAVLLSIILGLGVTQLLVGIRGQMLARNRVRNFWPTQLCSATLLMVSAQSWWAMFDLHKRRNWDFASFAVLLGQMIALYLAIGLVYPDFPSGETIDLRAHYFAQRRHFYALLLIVILFSVGRDLALNHRLPDRLNLCFHGVFAALVLSAFLISKTWFHRVIPLSITGLFIVYIALLFAH